MRNKLHKLQITPSALAWSQILHTISDHVHTHTRTRTRTRTHTHTHTHTHAHTRLTALCLGLPRWAGTRKVKPIWISLEQDSERQWYQLGHMQVCTLLQTDNHASTSLLKFFTGQMPFLPHNQQCQSTEGNLRPHTRSYICFTEFTDYTLYV